MSVKFMKKFRYSDGRPKLRGSGRHYVVIPRYEVVATRLFPEMNFKFPIIKIEEGEYNDWNFRVAEVDKDELGGFKLNKYSYLVESELKLCEKLVPLEEVYWSHCDERQGKFKIMRLGDEIKINQYVRDIKYYSKYNNWDFFFGWGLKYWGCK